MSLLSVEDVSYRYPTTVSDLPVLSHVDLALEEDSVLAVVGESGCGKTTLGRVVEGLVAPTSGKVCFEGTDLAKMTKRESKSFRRAVQLVHQDPYSSLNPGITVEDTLRAALLYHKVVGRREVRDEIVRELAEVGLDASDGFLQRYPHQLSGGQRQRLVIARAMSLKPKLVVADEAVSMLDVSMRVSVLDLLLSMRTERRLSYVFISHDFGVVRYFARGGRVAVMFFGVVVEEGPSEAVITHPRHPYTFLLLDAVPVADPKLARRRRTESLQVAEQKTEAKPSPTGCIFANRCPYAESRCHESRPPLAELAKGHRAACWFPERVPDLFDHRQPVEVSGS